MNQSAPLAPGTLLAGRYRLENVLGQGGMGRVYRARVEALGKLVAVKEMCVQGADANQTQAAMLQFHQEARLLANLEHPHLVQVTDYFDEAQRHYLVMAYVEGQSLANLLKARSDGFGLTQVLDWALQLTDVLGYLHGQNPPVIFRDLKPSNVMVDKAGIRLIDFGIARPYSPDSATASFLQGVGSAGYAPLEQYVGGGGTDPRSDIYALGATLFHLLSHQAPPSSAELAARGAGPPKIGSLRADVPPALDALIQTMMASNLKDRPQSVKLVRQTLEQISLALQNDEVTEVVGESPVAQPQVAYFCDADRVYPIPCPDCIVGRQTPSHLLFGNPQISRQHLRLVKTDRGFTATDLGSRFGSFVNGRPIGTEPVLLQDGDELVLGGVLSLRFADPSQTREGKRVGRLKGVWIDPDSLDVWVDGQPVSPPLSSAQLALLRLLETRTGSFFTRDQVIEAVWPDASCEGVSEEALDGLIKRLRARLKETGKDPIEVRRGQGLRLQAP